ncbi:MAG TPA: glycosyltransferase family 2 protein [Candidatus Acidoferrales bacterium]|nr:glycosyltransferase family 2 protein [Candidatus Acidoferrales bacterium]
MRKISSNQVYVLMTAAHNEEAFIEKTIRSVLSQTVLPKRWVIVSDNSTDRTDEIVENFAKQHEFIHFLKLTRPAGRNFGLKGMALQRGIKLLGGLSFEFIGNLDADVAIGPLYFEALMNHFDRDSKLGMAAGFIHEEEKGEFRSRAANRADSVPHAAQLVRRECYEVIGGYSTFKHGGEDWYAQQCAKMNGWRVEAIPALTVLHQRHTGAANRPLRHQFRLGRVDYSFGSDPVFEFLKCAMRLSERPWLVGAATRFLGYAWSGISREKRPVPQEFIDFLRKEQRAKILSVFRASGRERLRVQNP